MVSSRLERRPDYGQGSYRREISLRSEDGCVSGRLEDDFHAFGVSIRHDGRYVTEAEGDAGRFPWTTCSGAVDPLRRLIGMELSPRPGAVRDHTDSRAQCTHLLDLAGLAIALAARGGATRRYSLEVPDSVEGRSRPRLLRDGSEILVWELAAGRIAAPEPFVGQRAFGGGFTRWAERCLDPNLAEAAVVLQRACGIALGRMYDMDQTPGAWAFGAMAGPACHSFGPEHVNQARRMVGSARDFSRTPERLLVER
jgi:hypothetical protein